MKERAIKNIFVQGPVSPLKIAEDIQKHASKTDIGAHSIFLGQVRADHKSGQLVEAIEYTAYVEMALEKMQQIREELFAQHTLTCMHVYHSLGRVGAGEICLYVFVSSPHRKAALDACAQLVEAIKFQLPVWGREILGNEETIWKENK